VQSDWQLQSARGDTTSQVPITVPGCDAIEWALGQLMQPGSEASYQLLGLASEQLGEVWNWMSIWEGLESADVKEERSSTDDRAKTAGLKNIVMLNAFNSRIAISDAFQVRTRLECLGEFK
jgi:hypothetical protein